MEEAKPYPMPILEAEDQLPEENEWLEDTIPYWTPEPMRNAFPPDMGRAPNPRPAGGGGPLQKYDFLVSGEKQQKVNTHA